MRPPSCLLDPSVVLVADTSAAINLNATGCAAQILRALPNKLLIVDVVQEELEQGRDRGRTDAEVTGHLAKAGLIEVVTLGDAGARHFERLIIGHASETLDDGEAATIACAAERNAGVVIDERKAIRICGTLFETLTTAATIDILAHDAVQKELGREALAEAIFNALIQARMRVLNHHLHWVISLIGKDRAAICPSLPGIARGTNAATSGR